MLRWGRAAATMPSCREREDLQEDGGLAKAFTAPQFHACTDRPTQTHPKDGRPQARTFLAAPSPAAATRSKMAPAAETCSALTCPASAAASCRLRRCDPNSSTSLDSREAAGGRHIG